MTKTDYNLRAAAARQVLEGYKPNAFQDPETSIADLIAAIGHLCMLEQIDFLAAVNGGIRHWAVERINPKSTRPGPTVEITITVHGLAPPSKPVARRSAKPKRSRRARDGPSGK
jgi:hypothetical protein